MEEWLRDQAVEEAATVADMLAVGVDGYLRGSDMVDIRAEDVKTSKGMTAVHLGRSERGESTKSG